MCCIVGDGFVVVSLLKSSLRGVTYISQRWERFLRSVVPLGVYTIYERGCSHFSVIVAGHHVLLTLSRILTF